MGAKDRRAGRAVILASSLAFHPGDPAAALGRVLELGYRGLEVLCDPPWHPRGWPASTVRALAGSGAVLSLHAPIADVNLMSPHPQARAFAEAELRRTVVLAAELGASGVTFHIGYRSTGSPYDPPWEEAKEAIGRLAELARGLGVELLLENDPRLPLLFLWDLNLYADVLEELDLPGTLDLGHAWTAHGKEALSLIPRIAGRIREVHLHDNHGQDDEHLPLGSGVVDTRAALALLTPEQLVVEAKTPEALAHDIGWLERNLRLASL
jgi:sugar phosphate isomerase/epimerase